MRVSRYLFHLNFEITEILFISKFSTCIESIVTLLLPSVVLYIQGFINFIMFLKIQLLSLLICCMFFFYLLDFYMHHCYFFLLLSWDLLFFYVWDKYILCSFSAFFFKYMYIRLQVLMCSFIASCILTCHMLLFISKHFLIFIVVTGLIIGLLLYRLIISIKEVFFYLSFCYRFLV